MLSKKTQYALKALGYLASKYGEGPVLIAEISGEKKIPKKFLEAILINLKDEGFIESKKGKGGGYYLIKPPKKISIANAIRAINGPIALLPCVSLNFYQKCKDCNETKCGLNKTMSIVRDVTLKILEKRSIAELIDSK